MKDADMNNSLNTKFEKNVKFIKKKTKSKKKSDFLSIDIKQKSECFLCVRFLFIFLIKSEIN